MVFRRFSKSDWDGYSGATPFGEGADPLIGEVKIVSKNGTVLDEAQVIVDAEGSDVYAGTLDDGQFCWMLAKDRNVTNVLWELTMAGESVTEDFLVSLGYTSNHDDHE